MPPHQPHPAGRRTGSAHAARRQKGFALLELTIAILISGVLALWASTKLQQISDDATAQATGIHLDTLASSGQKYILVNYMALAAGTDVPAIVNDLAPTRDELIATGRLASGFPAWTPSNQRAQVYVTKSGCPGANCVITANACLTAAYQVRGKYRDDETTNVMMAMSGRGARSHSDNPSLVRGANMSIANPLGAVTGIVCGQSNVDAGLYDTFVKMNDNRDPNFQGGLTVSGTNATGEAMRVNGDLAVVDPATGQVCVQILKSGVININCLGQLNAKTGTFTGPQGTVKVGATGTNYTVDTAGKIRGDAGFWTAMGSVFGDNTLGIRAAGTVFTIQTSAGVDGLAVHDSGRTGSRNSMATPVLGLTDPVVPGQACSSAATQVGATQVTTAATTVLRSISGGGLAICDQTSGQWVAISRSASSGGACTTNGTSAISSAGVMLICSNGQWASLMDRFGYMVAAETWRAVDGSVIPKPSCGAGSTGTRLIATPGNEQQNIQYVNRFITDNGTSWTLRITNGNGGTIAGDVIVMSYCTY